MKKKVFISCDKGSSSLREAVKSKAYSKMNEEPFSLFEIEDMDNIECGGEDKQSVFDKHIQEADVFILLLHTRFTDNMRHEYELARKEEKKRGLIVRTLLPEEGSLSGSDLESYKKDIEPILRELPQYKRYNGKEHLPDMISSILMGAKKEIQSKEVSNPSENQDEKESFWNRIDNYIATNSKTISWILCIVFFLAITIGPWWILSGGFHKEHKPVTINDPVVIEDTRKPKDVQPIVENAKQPEKYKNDEDTSAREIKEGSSAQPEKNDNKPSQPNLEKSSKDTSKPTVWTDEQKLEKRLVFVAAVGSTLNGTNRKFKQKICDIVSNQTLNITKDKGQALWVVSAIGTARSYNESNGAFFAYVDIDLVIYNTVTRETIHSGAIDVPDSKRAGIKGGSYKSMDDAVENAYMNAYPLIEKELVKIK